jgi:dihydroorotate dehydrogenase
MNASGVGSTTARDLLALAESASGAVVFRPTTVHPFLHPEFRTLHNPGYDRYLPLVGEIKAFGKPIIGSVAGATADEYLTLARAFGEAGADLIEVNVAEPYVAATLDPWDDPAAFAKMLEAVRGAAARPIMLRCPERIPVPLTDLRQILNDAGVDAVVLANNFDVMEKFFLARGAGPLPTVVAFGGVKSGFDLSSALRKGASAVEVSSPLAVEGPRLFARLRRELEQLDGHH